MLTALLLHFHLSAVTAVNELPSIPPHVEVSDDSRQCQRIQQARVKTIQTPEIEKGVL